MVKENNLTITHPELCKKWDYEKNTDIPENFTQGSEKKIFWVQDYIDPKSGKLYKFSWCSSIANMVKNNYGCPYISGHAVWPSFNDLATTNPELATLWHPTKNNIKPTEITANSHKKVWWYLRYYDKNLNKTFEFEWLSTVKSMNLKKDGEKCPYLTGKAIWPTFNDLATTHPIIAEQWDYDKNYPLTPQQVSAGSHRKVWWILPFDDIRTGKHFVFSWSACIFSRCRNNNKCDCPYLTGHAVWPSFNDLVTTDKEIADTWHPTLNGQLKPTQFSRCSETKIWWMCDKGHSYKSMIISRTRLSSGCPYCIRSNTEKIMSVILENNKVDYEIEKIIENSYISQAPFDFFLIKKNLLLELDGNQHFEKVEFFERKFPFEKRTIVDNKKNKYAFENNIPLLRIPYTYFKEELKMESLILDFIRTRIIPKEIIDFYREYEFSNYAELAEKYNESLKLKVS